MSDGLHFLDIIIFAMVAAFLVLRLRAVLGRRTGTERPSHLRGQREGADQDNVIDLADARKVANVAPVDEGRVPGLAAIHAADAKFDADGFVAGARGAFQMIIGAYAAGDTRTLRPLLSDDVFRHFDSAIEARRALARRLDTRIQDFTAEITEAHMNGPSAFITIRFVSHQINVLRDAADRVIEGDPVEAVEVVDDWTFAREVTSSDPNWELVATHTPDH